MLKPEALEELVRARFPDAEVQLTDLTGTKDHYQLTVVSRQFEGVPPLQRHRLVYAALGEHMRGDIHALALRTYTPESRPE